MHLYYQRKHARITVFTHVDLYVGEEQISFGSISTEHCIKEIYMNKSCVNLSKLVIVLSLVSLVESVSNQIKQMKFS